MSRREKTHQTVRQQKHNIEVKKGEGLSFAAHDGDETTFWVRHRFGYKPHLQKGSEPPVLPLTPHCSFPGKAKDLHYMKWNRVIHTLLLVHQFIAVWYRCTFLQFFLDFLFFLLSIASQMIPQPVRNEHSFNDTQPEENAIHRTLVRLFQPCKFFLWKTQEEAKHDRDTDSPSFALWTKMKIMYLHQNAAWLYKSVVWEGK